MKIGGSLGKLTEDLKKETKKTAEKAKRDPVRTAAEVLAKPLTRQAEVITGSKIPTANEIGKKLSTEGLFGGMKKKKAEEKAASTVRDEETRRQQQEAARAAVAAGPSGSEFIDQMNQYVAKHGAGNNTVSALYADSNRAAYQPVISGLSGVAGNLGNVAGGIGQTAGQIGQVAGQFDPILQNMGGVAGQLGQTAGNYGQFINPAANPAANVDPAFRQYQMGLAQQLQAQAMGQGPSLAQLQLQQATDRTLNQSLGAIKSTMGSNPALAARTAALAGSSQLAGMGGQSAMLRLQEQQQAQQALAGLSGQARGQDVSAEQLRVQTQLQGRDQNLAALQGQAGTLNAQGNMFGQQAQGLSQKAGVLGQQVAAQGQQANVYSQQGNALGQQADQIGNSMAAQNAVLEGNLGLDAANREEQRKRAAENRQRENKYAEIGAAGVINGITTWLGS